MEQKSLPETAFAILSAKSEPLKFAELYALLAEELKMNEDEKFAHIGQFYTDISLDGRFVCLSDNFWDLRSRHEFDKVHIDMDAAYSTEESSADSEDEKEDEEYNAAMQGKTVISEEDDFGAAQEENEETAKRKEREEAAQLAGFDKSGSNY